MPSCHQRQDSNLIFKEPDTISNFKGSDKSGRLGKKLWAGDLPALLTTQLIRSDLQHGTKSAKG